MKNSFFHNLIEKYQSLNIIVKASMWFIIVTCIDRAISIFTQPFINRILTVEEVGIYGVYSSWNSIFTIIATFNLFGGVLEVYITKDKENKNNIVASLNILCLIIFTVFFGIAFVFISPLSHLLSLKPLYLIIMSASILGELMIQFWAVPKRFEYSYKIYGLITILLFAIKSILSVFLTYYCENDRLLGRLIGLVAPTVICGVILFIITISKSNLKGMTKYWIAALKFNLPLLPHYLSSILLSSSDKIMIEKLGLLYDAGLYSIAYSFSSLSLIVFSAINSAYNPYSMACIKDKQYGGLAKTTNVMCVFSIMFALLMIFMAPEGLFILGGFTNKYLESLPTIPILIVGIYFSSFYFVFSNVEFVYEKTKFIFPITLVGTIINIALNYFLIPKIGYKAAAYTTLIGYLFIAISHYTISRIILKQDIYNIKLLLIFISVFIGFSFLGLFLYKTHWMIRYFVIVLLLVSFVIFGIKKRHILFSKNKETDI